MALQPLTSFSRLNRRMILIMIAGHLLWSGAIIGLWSVGSLIESAGPWLVASFIAIQLYAAAQLLLPALLLQPEKRNRGFYLFWGGLLGVAIWSVNKIPGGSWSLLLVAVKSALLLLVATCIGVALARYVRRLWEIVPICLMMTLADFSSWLVGPTAGFAQQIQAYYLKPEGPPPLIDMLLIKLVFPGAAGLLPVFGISDWIMVVFFALVASRFGLNDNLLGISGVRLARQGRIGGYLPISVAALFAASLLAQGTGLFIPALPLIALIMLLWYAGGYLWRRRSL